MKTRTLGRTGIQVSELALGGLFVSSCGGPFEEARAAILRAIDLGGNYVDTAPSYLDSEEVLGKALDGVDAPLILSTKFGGHPKPFEPKNRDCLMRSLEQSLRLLRRDQIDILMIHEPDRPDVYDWWTDLEELEGPVLALLEELKKDGVIRFTGLAGTTAYEMPYLIRSGKFDVVLTAFNYSLLWREAEHAILPAAKEQEMGIVIGSPLQQGALARRYDDQVRKGLRWLSPARRDQFIALYDFLDEASMGIAELAMRFVISNPDISCVLTGARSRREVEDNVAAVEKGPLPREILARIDQISGMVPFRPTLEPWGLPFD